MCAKVDEEIAELTQTDDADAREDEMGDLLFAVVNSARWLEVEPEAALRRANGKFARRFTRVEAAAREQGRAMTDMTLAELDQLWEAAKAADAASGS